MADCNTCTKAEPVSYLVHESAMARSERVIKRLWITVIILICLLVATNGVWIWYESQWEDVSMTDIQQETDQGGSNYVVGGDFSGSTANNDNQDAGA